MKGVAPKGSMLASSILLIMELPAIEAARPARRPEDQPKHEWDFKSEKNIITITYFNEKSIID